MIKEFVVFVVRLQGVCFRLRLSCSVSMLVLRVVYQSLWGLP